MSGDVIDQGNGPVIVFLHNAASDNGLWHHQIAQFSGGYRVVAPNLPGHGDVPKADSVDQMADYISQLLSDRGIKEYAIVGLCLGGMVALELANREGSKITSLTLIETVPRETNGRLGLRIAERLFGAFGGIPPWIANLLAMRHVSRLNREARSYKRDALGRMQPANTLAIVRAVLNFNGTAALARLTLPTLFLVGEENKLRHQSALEHAEYLPRADVIMIPRSGQLVALEAPTMVNNALRQFWHQAARPLPLGQRLR